MTKTVDHKRLSPAKNDVSAIAVSAIISEKSTDFDLYLAMGDQLVLYARAPYLWGGDELKRLLADGHANLYYLNADEAKVEAYRVVHQTSELDRQSPPRTRIVNLTGAAAELSRILYQHPLTIASLSRATEIAAAMVTCIEEDKSCISALGKLALHDDYTYYHSARVAAYTLAIAVHLSQRDRAQLQEMAIGALLHDIGKSKIDLEVLNKRGALSPEEWKLMRLHPVFGDEIISPSLLSHAPRQIILHHHERFDGSGYPHNLAERELLEEVKIAAFADVFDALTTNRPYQVSRTHFEALDFIRHKLLANLHKDSFQAMIEILGGSASSEDAAGDRADKAAAAADLIARAKNKGVS